MKLDLTINCCLCEAEHKSEIEMPEGWNHRYGAIDDEQAGFCPKHSAVAAFAESQCPGCVGGWGDCPMWQAFAYAGRQRTMGVDDYVALERGICPRRVNGTIGVSAGQREDLDLSETAPVESGSAFAAAIRDYIAKYP